MTAPSAFGIPSTHQCLAQWPLQSLVHQKQRALVVVTLPDHEAWLTNWQFTA
jgi:hypothetical protein